MACWLATGGTGTAPAGMLGEDGDVGVEPGAGAAPDVGGTEAPRDGVAAELDAVGAPRAATSPPRCRGGAEGRFVGGRCG